MWLLNARTRKLECYHDADAIHQQYAILSHVWCEEEVTFHDLDNLETAQRKQGYRKIDFSCYQALKDGLSYVWIDTCCIDKSSSAELSEAINSMFRWYRDSAICYVYLVDYVSSANSLLEDSRWFTRGWTLQELIAPLSMDFYSREWAFLGTKESLCSELEDITTIPEYVLQNHNYLDTMSVAKRMSWAASRQTTRPEDMAYCLLGIFDVNIPLLYGEGYKAFHRLQEAIMRRSTDHSVLVWQPSTTSSGLNSTELASSPSDFADSGRIIQYTAGDVPDPYELTNAGIRMTLPLHVEESNLYLLLDCRYEDDFTGIIGIRVEILKDASETRDGVAIIRRVHLPYVNTKFDVRLIEGNIAELMSAKLPLLLVHHHHQAQDVGLHGLSNGVKLWLQLDNYCAEMFDLVEAQPQTRWNNTSKVFSWSGSLVPSTRDHVSHIVLEHYKCDRTQLSKFNRLYVFDDIRKDPTGLYILLLFKARIGQHLEQECFIKAISCSARPCEAEIQSLRRADMQAWTNIGNDEMDDVHVVSRILTPLHQTVEITACREVVMSAPVYVIRVSSTSRDLQTLEEDVESSGIRDPLMDLLSRLKPTWNDLYVSSGTHSRPLLKSNAEDMSNE